MKLKEFKNIIASDSKVIVEITNKVENENKVIKVDEAMEKYGDYNLIYLYAYKNVIVVGVNK